MTKIKNFKCFESVNSDEYYTELSGESDEGDEGDEGDGDDVFIDVEGYKRFEQKITENEVNYIKGFLTKKYSIYSVVEDRVYISKKIEQYGSTGRFLGVDKHYGTIIKRKDDWYVLVVNEIQDFSNFIQTGDIKYYKCDRLDGLEKCFKEKCV